MSSKAHRYNENYLSVQQQTKNVDSNRKHIKKQIFGEIKNVIHNQAVVTPLKQDSLDDKKTSSKYSHSNFKNIQPIKDEVNNVNNAIENTKSKYSTDLDDTNFLDCFDFRGECCSSVQKSDPQIWSEMNFYDDSFLNKILDAGQLVQTEEYNCEEPNIEGSDEDPEFFNDIKDESNSHYWPVTYGFSSDPDLHLCLQKPVIDFDF